uniref:Secreted protein n=1 Tax=Macrostomum lignano TaxID=282301 RepID=A0A1I8FCU1_9PLAT
PQPLLCLNGRGAWLISLCLLLVGTTACVACLCGLRRRAAAGSSAPAASWQRWCCTATGELRLSPWAVLDGEDRNGDAHRSSGGQSGAARQVCDWPIRKRVSKGATNLESQWPQSAGVELNCLKSALLANTARDVREAQLPQQENNSAKQTSSNAASLSSSGRVICASLSDRV